MNSNEKRMQHQWTSYENHEITGKAMEIICKSYETSMKIIGKQCKSHDKTMKTIGRAMGIIWEKTMEI